MPHLNNFIVLLYGWGPEETGRLSALLHLAATAIAMDLETKIFLFTDGATLAKAGVAAKIDPAIAERFRMILQDDKAKVFVCEEAAAKRAIGRDDVEPGISMVGYATFLASATEARAVITI